jgi:homoserine O-acetyltransferase
MSLASAEACAPAHSEPDCFGLELKSGLPSGGHQRFEFELSMKHAGTRRVSLAVEWCGDPQLPAVWLAGGISAHRHACANQADPQPGWWQELIDAHSALDPQRYCLIACDWVGADGDIDAPISSEDQADAIAHALDLLGIRCLQAFVGASYGGMVGQAFAARHPQRLARLVCLSAGPRPHPFASAFRALQRQVVALGQLQCADQLGLSLARQFAMLSYRSPAEFAQRFDAPSELSNGRARCAAEGYLANCGSRYTERWSATAFLRLSESIDLHAIEPARIGVPTHLLAVTGDWLAPPEDLQAFAAAIAAPAEFECIESLYGHDAFLKETDRVGDLIERALAAPIATEVN